MPALMRQPQGYWPHFAALGYALAGYAGGLWCMTAQPAWLNALGTLALAHALVVAAYLLHECAHNTVFADPRHNARLGEALSFLVGAAYVDYAVIRHKHMRHHTDRADVVAFDLRRLLLRRPWMRRTVEALEWAWIPAVDLLMHGLVLVLPFVLPQRRHQRRRVVLLLVIRGTLFWALAWISAQAVLLYALAYLLFLHILRFMDVHQHTYSLVEALDSGHACGPAERDRAYEDRNTFSNPISRRHPWLNLLTLNFGYHNAHHVHPTTPWYALPKLHEQLPAAAAHTLPFPALLKSYARHRVARVLNGDPADTPMPPPDRFVGVVGVSFLTAH